MLNKIFLRSPPLWKETKENYIRTISFRYSFTAKYNDNAKFTEDLKIIDKKEREQNCNETLYLAMSSQYDT